MDSNKKNKTYTRSEALLKAASFCAYQERTQQEVRDKLYEYGLYGDEVEEIISYLITENYINEERFAQSYARGKFRLKKWGRLKVRQGLKQHGLSDYCIRMGMKEIDEEEYDKTLSDLLEKKHTQLKEPNPLKKKQKLVAYALSKGYENDIVWTKVNELVR
jgi:regulatory protein